MNRRRVSQRLLGCFLVLLLLAPLYESFDRWDGFPEGGNDTVLNLIGAVAFCGLVLVAARRLPLLLSALKGAFSVIASFHFRSFPLSLLRPSCIGESPPPLHLSPLRV